jgi:hypothetical protein
MDHQIIRGILQMIIETSDGQAMGGIIKLLLELDIHFMKGILRKRDCAKIKQIILR